MSPRIPVDGLGRDRHGALDARVLEPEHVRQALEEFERRLAAVNLVDPVITELVRMRNAVQQQCHL